MKLFLLITVLLVTSCSTSRIPAAESNRSSSVLSVVLQAHSSSITINEVITACNCVKPMRGFTVSNSSPERIEIKLTYNNITNQEREELYHALYSLGGVINVRQME